QHSGLPAPLPKHSRAAAAQNLGASRQKPVNGVFYEAAHNSVHPKGWRTKRHIKRRNLRRNTLQYEAVERIGTQWSMLPMAFGTMAVMIVLASVFVGVTAMVQATQQRYQQKVTTLQDVLPKDNLKMYDAHGTEIYQMINDGIQTTVPLSHISKNLINAEISIEDQYFWSNPGYDITGVIRAALANLSSGHIVSGGSTITQQLIKNTIVGNQDTAIRKLQEIILAPDISRYYTKQQIMAMYLNTIYYGQQAYGAETAAFTYFNLQPKGDKTAADQLDIAQAAMLAGIPSSPIGRNPILHPKAAQARIAEVLRQMHVQGYITSAQQRDALLEAASPNFIHPGVIKTVNLATHFANYALNEVAKTMHIKVADLARSGMSIKTTLDLPLQNKVLKDAQQHISALAAAHNMSNAAVVVIDYHTGAIKTIVGNIDPNNPQDGAFDVATEGYRQPGSSFKPFIYATLFGQGVSPGAPVLDESLSVPMCCGLPSYQPKNYDLRYHGLVTFRYALQNSLNIPAVKALMQTGVDPALHTAQVMGINSYQGTPNYTMVLGTLSVHLLDETSAYGTFANGGVRIPPHAVDTITDDQGHVIYTANTQGKRVISKQEAFITTNVLSDNSSRTFEFGACSPLLLYTTTESDCLSGNPGNVRPAAAKTGTSNDFRDNWTVGYTSDYVVGVWAGNNDNSPMVNVSGIDGAAPIWHDTMEMFEQGKPIKGFSQPSGVVKRTVSYSGLTSTDWYLGH
ncbi:MAG TPA: transglycosylase domain-containing protein, partial [Ktedonobacteraceae bacterium]|nr:transglycosylase domain-containing protein [Ktedonobacteraceae bacterium]